MPQSQVCDCPSCRLEEAVFSIIVDPRTGSLIEVEDALPAMTRIFGSMLASVEACELEAIWRIVLDVRCRALDLGADSIGATAGRC